MPRKCKRAEVLRLSDSSGRYPGVESCGFAWRVGNSVVRFSLTVIYTYLVCTVNPTSAARIMNLISRNGDV